jgi:phosphate uptake regulator
MLDLSNYALKSFNDCLQKLAGLMSQMVEDAMAIEELIAEDLKRTDAPATHAHEENIAKKLDKQVNQREYEIIAVAQEAISKFAPMGDSLRFVIGCVKVSTLLELIGDRAKNSYKRLHKINTALDSEVRDAVAKMVQTNLSLLNAMRGLISEYNEDIVKSTVEEVRSVENLYKQIWPQKRFDDADYHNIIMLAKNQQRIADLVVDTKRILYFVHTGKNLDSKFSS